MPYPWECLDCAWLDMNDSNRWDSSEYWCSVRRYYVRPNSASCDKLKKKGSTGGCYLTTAMCNILGFEDHCEVLDTLRAFRDDYMKNTDECKPLLEDYDNVGPVISKYLDEDTDRVQTSLVMLNSYIKPAIDFIDAKNYDAAIDVYKDMTLSLMEFYDLDTDELSFMKENKSLQRKRKDTSNK